MKMLMILSSILMTSCLVLASEVGINSAKFDSKTQTFEIDVSYGGYQAGQLHVSTLACYRDNESICLLKVSVENNGRGDKGITTSTKVSLSELGLRPSMVSNSKVIIIGSAYAFQRDIIIQMPNFVQNRYE